MEAREGLPDCRDLFDTVTMHQGLDRRRKKTFFPVVTVVKLNVALNVYSMISIPMRLHWGGSVERSRSSPNQFRGCAKIDIDNQPSAMNLVAFPTKFHRSRQVLTTCFYVTQRRLIEGTVCT